MYEEEIKTLSYKKRRKKAIIFNPNTPTIELNLNCSDITKLPKMVNQNFYS